MYIVSIDRLGRNYDVIQNEWRILTKEIGVHIVVISMPILDTRDNNGLIGTFIADIILQVLSFVAHNERDNIKKTQLEGIEAAKRRGVRFGRPPIPIPDNFGEIIKQWENKKITFDEVLSLTELKESTFYRRLREYKLLNNK